MKRDIRAMDKYKATKQKIKFEDWWDLIVEKYSCGYYDMPAIGADPDREYPYYIPCLEDVEKFRNNAKVKEAYRVLYDEGDSVENAIIAMY